MIYVSDQARWVREEQLNACLGNEASLCSAQLRMVAHACLSIATDPRATQAIRAEANELGGLGRALLSTHPGRLGEHVLAVSVVRRRLKQTMEDAAALRWLARFHPDALALFLTVCEGSLRPRAADPNTDD